MRTKKEVFDRGYDRAISIAQFVELVDLGHESIEAEIDAFEEAIYDIEMSNRDFSPFELTAKMLNDLDADDSIDFDPWEIFEEGIAAGVQTAVDDIFGK